MSQEINYQDLVVLLQKELKIQTEKVGHAATAEEVYSKAFKQQRLELSATKDALEKAVQHNAALLPKAEAFDVLKEAWDKYTLRWVFDKGRRGAGIFRKILDK